MKRKQWMLGVLSILFCAMITLVDPVRTEAASQTDRSAYNEVFDASYYYSAYPDVAAAFGMNEKALFEHFVNHGVREGRSGSAEFNPQVYRQNYSDLQAAFGDDMAAYCRHYVRYGRAEGRSAGGSGQVSVPAGTIGFGEEPSKPAGSAEWNRHLHYSLQRECSTRQQCGAGCCENQRSHRAARG